MSKIQSKRRIFFNLQVDCEASQRSIDNVELGKRAVEGIHEVLADASRLAYKATYVVIPKDLQAYGEVYRMLEQKGHEIGLHLHPKEDGWEEFLGIYGYEEQKEIIDYGKIIYEDTLGHSPTCFTPGYFSANDYTFPILEELGFTHGSVSLPTRDLPQCACIWGSSPLYAHYPHRFNRSLQGNVNFVNIPITCDTASRMWGGATPLDLRVELVDAKNHYYTIEKSIKHQLKLAEEQEKDHVCYIKALTHNIFDYSDKKNFRRQTLASILDIVQDLADRYDLELVPATTRDIAEVFRSTHALPEKSTELELDQRGRKGWSK